MSRRTQRTVKRLPCGHAARAGTTWRTAATGTLVCGRCWKPANPSLVARELPPTGDSREAIR